MIFDTLFPEVLALVAALEEKLDNVFVVALEKRTVSKFSAFMAIVISFVCTHNAHISLGMQFNK